jgi:hypothetical protein
MPGYRLHPALQDTEQVQQLLDEHRTELEQLAALAQELHAPDCTNAHLHEVATQRFGLTRTASLQLFPIELEGRVTACVGLAAGAELALSLRVEAKHGMRLVPLDQEAIPAPARVAKWADLLADPLRFRTVPEALAANLPDLVAACLHMDTYQDDKLLLKFHVVQPEINTQAGPQPNPDWEATRGVQAHVWTLSVKHDRRECFKVGAALGAQPYVIPFNPLSPFYNSDVPVDEAKEGFANAHFRLKD